MGTYAKKATKKSQTGSMRQVWYGTKKYTKSGATKKDLVRKKGHIMTKKQFKNGQKLKKSSPWLKAVAKARKELKIKGFVLMNRASRAKHSTRRPSRSCKRLVVLQIGPQRAYL